jgi:hypothetical protein
MLPPLRVSAVVMGLTKQRPDMGWRVSMTQNNNEVNTNGWSRAEMHVLAELQRLSIQIGEVDEKLTNLRIGVAKNGAAWGAVSGAIVAIVGMLLRK